MSKRKTVVIFALLVAVMPLLGVPQSWKDGFYIVVGLLIALLAYLPDRVYCDECRKIVSSNGHRDKMAAEMRAPAVEKVSQTSVSETQKSSDKKDNEQIA